MKNIKLASALALAMGLAAVGTASAQTASGGTITFHGTVTDTTCTVRGGGGTDGGTGNFSVTLPNIPATDLSVANSTGGPQQFNVLIGAPDEDTCGVTADDGSVIATMTFGLTPTTDANGNLNNLLTDSSGATKAQIQLLNKDGTVINLNSANAGSQNATIVNHQATMTYTARYISVPGGATPGKLETNTIYSIAYN